MNHESQARDLARQLAHRAVEDAAADLPSFVAALPSEDRAFAFAHPQEVREALRALANTLLQEEGEGAPQEDAFQGRSFVVYEGSGDWSALYVDGALKVVGDHYLIDETLRTIAGVETLQSDAFLRGGCTREEVAPTLEALHSWERQEEGRRRLLSLLVEVKVEGETFFWPTEKTLTHPGLVYGDEYLEASTGRKGTLTPEDKFLLSLMSYEAEDASGAQKEGPSS